MKVNNIEREPESSTHLKTRQDTEILNIGSFEMFFTLRQMSISIWSGPGSTLSILKQQQTYLTRVLKVWSYEFDEKTSTVD